MQENPINLAPLKSVECLTFMGARQINVFNEPSKNVVCFMVNGTFTFVMCSTVWRYLQICCVFCCLEGLTDMLRVSQFGGTCRFVVCFAVNKDSDMLRVP